MGWMRPLPEGCLMLGVAALISQVWLALAQSFSLPICSLGGAGGGEDRGQAVAPWCFLACLDRLEGGRDGERTSLECSAESSGAWGAEQDWDITQLCPELCGPQAS